MVKHWAVHHSKVGSPVFKFRVAKTYRDALSRQVGEAVRIDLRQSVLNSKSEYTRCKLPRLVIDESCFEEREKDIKKLEESCQQAEEERRVLEEQIKQIEVKKRGRLSSSLDQDQQEGRQKKRKYRLLPESWGEKKTEEGNQTQSDRQRFLMDPATPGQVQPLLQPKLMVLTGVKLWATETVRTVVERAWVVILQHQAEDDTLWRMQEDMDKEQESAKIVSIEVEDKSVGVNRQEKSGKITDWVKIFPKVEIMLRKRKQEEEWL